MTWQTRLTRANATSLCTSAYYLRHHYQCIILGLWFFWAYDFVCVWFVCVWLFCAYDFYDDAPVPVAYRKNSNKWTMYSDFLNFHLWKHRILQLTLTFTWGVHVWSGGRGSEDGPRLPDPTCSLPILRGIFQSIHGSSSYTTVYIVDLTPSQHVLATRIT